MRIQPAHKIYRTRDNSLTYSVKSRRTHQRSRSVEIVQSAESAGQFNRFAARQKQRALAILHRAGNYHAGTNPGADIPGNFVVAFPALAKILHDIENNADCFLSVLVVRNWKSKEGDHAFAVGGMQVSPFLCQVRSGLANKF